MLCNENPQLNWGQKSFSDERKKKTSNDIIKVKVCQPNEKIKGGIVMTRDDISSLAHSKNEAMYSISGDLEVWFKDSIYQNDTVMTEHQFTETENMAAFNIVC